MSTDAVTISDADVRLAIEMELWGCKSLDVAVIAQRIIDALHRQGYRIVQSVSNEP